MQPNQVKDSIKIFLLLAGFQKIQTRLAELPRLTRVFVAFILTLIGGRACFAGEGEPIILLGEALLGLGIERLFTSAFNYSRVSSWL